MTLRHWDSVSRPSRPALASCAHFIAISFANVSSVVLVERRTRLPCSSLKDANQYSDFGGTCRSLLMLHVAPFSFAFRGDRGEFSIGHNISHHIHQRQRRFQKSVFRGENDFSKGRKRITGLVLTHGDSQHIGGITQLLTDFPRVRLIDNPAPDRSLIHRRLSRIVSELEGCGRKPAECTAGDNFHLSRDAIAHVLFPPRGFAGATADDQALVIRLLISPETFVLFMSDNGAETERALLSNGSDVHSDILVKGQHYSGISGSAPFLDAVRPRLIIATSAQFPERERVSDEWADQVRARGIRLFRQDETGAVELKFRGNEWSARAYLTGEVFRSVSR